jgi:hypothetical protein
MIGRQILQGAGVVLALGILVAGCSKDGDTFLSGGGSLLQNTDTTPFGRIVTNNLAPDGGGFTPNASNHSAWQVAFNCDAPKSDGSFSGDESAIVLFSLANNRVYASHFLAGSFTPPSELEAADRDYGVAVALNSYIMIPLNTANYQAGAASPAAEVNAVRANAGAWLILGEFQTIFVTPGQKIDDATTIGKGVRRTLGSWVFLKSERDKSLSTATLGGAVREFRHGFQRSADEVPTALTAGGIGTAPPNSVMSYGVATDGLAGQAVFRGQGNPFGITSTDRAFWLRGGQSGATMQPNFESARYRAGEDVSLLAAVFTQVESSLASQGDALRRSSLDAVTKSGGQAFMRYRTFSLATLSWGTEGQISTGIRTADGSGATEAGAGVTTDIQSYNGTVFYRYMDASLRTNSSGTFTVDTLDIVSNRFMIAATRFLDAGNGSCAINSVGTANAIDVSTDAFCVSTSGPGVPGAHTTSVPSTTAAVGPTNPAPSFENAVFLRSFEFTPDRDDYRTIYGPDEGLEELSLFFRLADGTASGTGATGSGPNADAELAVVALAKSGALSTSAFVAGTNPLRISGAHATDNQANTQASTTTNIQLTDRAGNEHFALNRTGRWLAIGFTRDTGVGENNAFGTDLYVNVYQPFRLVSSNTGGGTGGTAANMQDRFLAAGPTVVNSTLSINAASTNGNRLPVNGFAFQGNACYRGLQSDSNVLNLFFEHSDTTSDRVFASRLQVTLNGSSTAPAAPTLAAGAPVELTFTDKVSGDAAFNNANGTPGPSSFDFVDRGASIGSPTRFSTTDAGPDQGNASAPLGNALVVFRRVDDATTVDSGGNDLGDVSIYATTFNGTAFETPVKICTTGDSNELVAGNLTGGSIKIDSLVATHRNTDIAGRPNFPTHGDEGYFVVLFKDREAGLTTASGANTTTVVPGNATSRIAQYARRIGFMNSASGPALPAASIAERVRPAVTNTSTAPFALPSQLDHAQGAATDASKILVCSNRSGVGVVFRFNNQVWYQATSDGLDWLRESGTGLPNPGLVSNFSSADVAADADFELHCCGDNEGNQGAGFVLFRKADVGGTTRGFAATRSN